jgi:hypothetical protein
MSSTNPKTIYIGANYLFRSLDFGDHWMIISPDLTTNDTVKTSRNTGGITIDATGAETHCTIITISESPVRSDVIWVGTDDGNVQVTKNSGVLWTNVRPKVPDVPPFTWVSRVEASHFNAGTCYLTFDGHRSDNFKPYVFVTTDYGENWTPISNGIPVDQPVYVIREDAKNANLLFLGTEFAAYFSINKGQNWSRLNNNLPTVAIHDLLIHPRDNDLIAATHGRGIWIMDNITALQQATPEVLNGDAFLFKTRLATQWISAPQGNSSGAFRFVGQNAPGGALIEYYLKTKPTSPAIIEISNATGEMKRTYTVTEAGIGRIVWNYSFDAPAPTAQQISQQLTTAMQTVQQRTDLTAVQQQQIQQFRNQIQQAGTDVTNLQNILNSIRTAFGLAGGAAGGGRGGAGGGAGGFGGGGGGRGGGGGGQAAGPGTYGVKLTVDGKTYTALLTVRQDPLLNEK